MNTTATARILSSLLLCSLIASVFSACGSDSSSGNTAQTDAVETTEVTEAETTSYESTLPSITFDGEATHFLTEENSYAAYTSIEIFSEGADGSLINDAVYERNLVVEEKFDTVITETRLNGASNVAKSSILAGDNEYDVVAPYLNSSVQNAQQGQYYDLHTVEHLALENEWWDQRANDNLAIHGKLYFTTGDISILDNDCTMVMFFNKKQIADHSLPNPYELVTGGKWTLDALFESSLDLSNDIDGDGELINEKDSFGIFIAGNVPHSMFFGTGERIVSTTDDGDLELVMYNDRSAEVMNKIFEYCLDPNVMCGTSFQVSADAFNENRLCFAGWALTDINSIRDCEHDFGILPYPKYEEAQEEYYSLISTSLVPGFSIPITNANPSKAGLILEALAYYSVDTLTEAFYYTALNDRYIRDTESSEMLDIIFATRVYDFGYIFNTGGLGTLIQTMYDGGNGSNNFASRYASLESAAQAAIAELSEAFKD